MFYRDQLEGCLSAVFFTTTVITPVIIKNITGLMHIRLKSLVFNIRTLCLSEAER